jgi:hypothetical protein
MSAGASPISRPRRSARARQPISGCAPITLSPRRRCQTRRRELREPNPSWANEQSGAKGSSYAPCISCNPQYRDALRFVTEWNKRQAQRAPLLFSPTIGVAVAAQHWYLWVRCPGCCCTQSVDLRRLDRHPDMMVTGLISLLSCRARRPHASFAELVKLSPTSIAGELREEHRKRVLGE